jgi:hypothetical protein
MDLNSFSDEYLFAPIGMERTSFYTGGVGGNAWTYADMLTSPRDFARMGWLVMNGGVWNGERIISTEFLEEMLAPKAVADFYGLLWWLHDAADLKGYGTEGYLDTDMYIFPREELIVVRMQAPRNQFTGGRESGNYQELAWELFKAFAGPEKTKAIDTVLRKLDTIPEPVESGAEQGASETESSRDIGELSQKTLAEDLAIAIEDSRAGKTGEVIWRLKPYLDERFNGVPERAKAALLLITQHRRIGNTARAREIFEGISVDSVNQLSTWYQDYYEELKPVFQ